MNHEKNNNFFILCLLVNSDNFYFLGKDWLIILLTMIGRLSVAACWQILYLWCLELFPTTMRLTMLEVSMIVGHIGSTASPFINDAVSYCYIFLLPSIASFDLNAFLNSCYWNLAKTNQITCRAWVNEGLAKW